MSDTFFDNQEVTADDLNNIAKDLGKTDYSYFPENPPISAVTALNQITADLVGKGVLNTMNECNVTVSGDTATVNTGIIVFGSGAKKRITEAQTITIQSGAVNYIYALNDTSNNKALLISSVEQPTTGDFVDLAKIDESGKVTMTRNWAKAKVDLPTLQKYKTSNTRFSIHSTNPEYTFDVGFSDFNFMIATVDRSNNGSGYSPCIIFFEEGVEKKVYNNSRMEYFTALKQGSKVTLKNLLIVGYVYIYSYLIA